MTLWPKGGTLHLWLTRTASSTESGATDLLATSSTFNWLMRACMPLINWETLEEAHGMANLEISLSLMTSITWKIIGVPRMTRQFFIPGSSIVIAIWSLLYPLTQGILTFIIMNPSGSTMIPPMPHIGGIFPPTSWVRLSKDMISIPHLWMQAGVMKLS